MNQTARRLALQDFSPSAARFLEEALEGLSKPRKTLPSKYFYDERGSQLFEEICRLDEYYPTRTELAILRARVDEMAEVIGPQALIVEYGSGASIKTRLLLDALHDPVAYVPVEISKEFLEQTAEAINADYPSLEVLPVCADYTAAFDLPEPSKPALRDVAYFPGSTLGNFEPAQAKRFLSQVAHMCGKGGALLIGLDLRKDPRILEAAYNDSEGVTAAFNLNILARMNRELRTDFDLKKFEHRAIWNEEKSRIEMHLWSTEEQTVLVGDEPIHFREGESICTEYSHKFSIEGFRETAEACGFSVERVWTDADDLFSVQYLVVR